MVQPLFSDVRCQIASDQLVRHVCLVRHASPEHFTQDRSRTEYSATYAKGESSGVPLERGDVVSGNLVKRDWVDEEKPLHAIRPCRRQTKRNRRAEVESDDGRFREPERREGPVYQLGLGGDAEVRVEWAVRLAIAEQVDGERRPVGEGNLRRDVSPDEAQRTEAVQEDDRSSAVAVALDVNRAWPDRNSQQIGVDGSVTSAEGLRKYVAGTV